MQETPSVYTYCRRVQETYRVLFRIAGLPDDLHLHGTQFNTALTVFYVL